MTDYVKMHERLYGELISQPSDLDATDAEIAELGEEVFNEICDTKKPPAEYQKAVLDVIYAWLEQRVEQKCDEILEARCKI